MKNELPLVYALFRTLWSSVHVVLAGLALATVTIWFLHDHQGTNLMSSIWDSLTEIQYRVANVIKFPWGG